MTDVDVAVRGTARVGEGPVWDAAAGRLHWVDILGGALHTSVPHTGATTTVTVPTLLGAAVPRRAGGFVAATSRGFAAIDGDGGFTPRLDVLPDGFRMNDAKCDPRGRFWAGSTEMGFAPGAGRLHVLMPDWTSRVLLDGLTLPNGLDWSPDGRTFYLVDTEEHALWAFDVDLDGPTLGDKRLLARFPDGAAMPDGLTVDAAGHLWIAMWGGGRVVELAPDGTEVRRLPMPARQPSSCAFGGTDLDVLYVTSAREGLDLAPDDPAGSVFAVTGLDARGTLPAPFAG